jgi:hypothetical protein
MGGRIDKAMPIVLAGAIALLSDGRTIVGAQAQSVRQDVVNGTSEGPECEVAWHRNLVSNSKMRCAS